MSESEEQPAKYTVLINKAVLLREQVLISKLIKWASPSRRSTTPQRWAPPHSLRVNETVPPFLADNSAFFNAPVQYGNRWLICGCKPTEKTIILPVEEILD